MLKKGLIHIYTGDGKGKTSAALGAAMRAAGNGLKVCWICFHKEPSRQEYGEFRILKKIKVPMYSFAHQHPLMDKKYSRKEAEREIKEGIKTVRQLFLKKIFDMIIMDEIIVSVSHELLSERELLSFLKDKPVSLELLLTGRGASRHLVMVADYVSCIEKIKHPYDRGVKARQGIEY